MHVSLPLCPLFQVEQWAQVGRPSPSCRLSPWDCRSCLAASSTPKLSRTAARSTMTSHSVRQTTLVINNTCFDWINLPLPCIHSLILLCLEHDNYMLASTMTADFVCQPMLIIIWPVNSLPKIVSLWTWFVLCIHLSILPMQISITII